MLELFRRGAFQKFKDDTWEGIQHVQGAEGLKGLFLVIELINFFTAPFGVLLTSVIQLSTPTEIRGRVFGLLGTLSAGLRPTSLGLAGVIAD